MNDLKFIRLYFSAPMHEQCIYKQQVEDLAGVERGTINIALSVDDIVSEDDLNAIVTVLKML